MSSKADIFMTKIYYLGPDVFWYAKGATAETSWLDETKRFPYMYYILQAGDSRPCQFPAETVAIPDPRRGSAHKKFQVSAMAAFAQLSKRWTTSAYW